jgi:hypothetical protein
VGISKNESKIFALVRGVMGMFLFFETPITCFFSLLTSQQACGYHSGKILLSLLFSIGL